MHCKGFFRWLCFLLCGILSAQNMVFAGELFTEKFPPDRQNTDIGIRVVDVQLEGYQKIYDEKTGIAHFFAKEPLETNKRTELKQYRIANYWITEDTNTLEDDNLPVVMAMRPDLYIKSFGPESEVFSAYELTGFEMVYGNLNSTAVEKAWMSIKVDGEVIHTFFDTELRAGRTQTMHFSLIMPAGTHTVEVAIDYQNEIEETNEMNNTKSGVYTWIGEDSDGSDLTIQLLTPADKPIKGPMNTEDFTEFQFQVQNIGSGDTAEGDITVAVREYGWKINEFTIDQVPAKEITSHDRYNVYVKYSPFAEQYAETIAVPQEDSITEERLCVEMAEEVTDISQVEGRADIIIKAKVLPESETVFTTFSGYTKTKLQVTEVIKGSLETGDEISLREPYYVDDRDGQEEIIYRGNYGKSEVGQEYLFFLSKYEGTELYGLRFLTMGRYPILDTRTRESRDLSNQALNLGEWDATFYKKVYEQVMEKYLQK